MVSEISINLKFYNYETILFLLAVAVVVAAASCQNDAILDGNLASKVDCGELSSPYAISKEEALDRLDDFMGVFDDCETRSHRRRVASINSV